jgi:hypothetical protein
MNTLYILTEPPRQQFRVLGQTEQYTVKATKMKDSFDVPNLFTYVPVDEQQKAITTSLFLLC